MTGVASNRSLDIDESGSKPGWLTPSRSATTIRYRLERLAPTVEPTLSSIGGLLQFAFADASANEIPAYQPSELRRLFRASVREDLSRVLTEIHALQEPDVSDELYALAEAVCAASQEDQTPEGLQEWARELSIGITTG